MASSSSLDSDKKSLESKALVIADNLYRSCVAPDAGKRLRETGSISPGSSLKQSNTNSAFRWVNEIDCRSSPRFFTEAACQLGIKKLLEKPGVEIPAVVGLPFELWLTQQARIVQHLCQRARKTVGSALRFQRIRQSRTMDWAETLPMQASYCLEGRWAHWIQLHIKCFPADNAIFLGKQDLFSFWSKPWSASYLCVLTPQFKRHTQVEDDQDIATTETRRQIHRGTPWR
jgi:hypothetical protein